MPLLRLKLTEVERKAVEALVDDPAGQRTAHVEARAAALATDSNGDVRRRCLAKSVALEEELLAQMRALLADALRRRDEAAARLLERSMAAGTARYTKLLDQLGADHAGGRRPVVLVNEAHVDLSGR